MPRCETLTRLAAAERMMSRSSASLAGRATLRTVARCIRPQSVTLCAAPAALFSAMSNLPAAPRRRLVERSGPLRVEELQQARENVDVAILAHEDVLMAVVREDRELVPARHDLLQPLVSDDVRVGEDVILLAGHEQDRRFDLRGVLQIIVRQQRVFRVVVVIF